MLEVKKKKKTTHKKPQVQISEKMLTEKRQCIQSE